MTCNASSSQSCSSRCAGLADNPIGKVYHMPGASDAYVTAFRSWLQRSAGGGPFGPQDQRWLQVLQISGGKCKFRGQGLCYS